MPGPKKRRDLFSRSTAIKEFTDRDSHIRLFRTKLDAFKRGKAFFLTFYGMGGIGKSSLCDQLVVISAKEGVDAIKINLFNPQFHNIEGFLLALRRELSALRGFRAPIFDSSIAVYWKKAGREPQKELGESFPIGSFLGDVISLVSGIGFIGVLPGIIDLIRATSKRMRELFSKRGEPFLKRFIRLPSEYQMVKYLPQALGLDMVNYALGERRSVVVMLDTYEALWGKLTMRDEWLKTDEWIRDLVIETLEHVSWVFFGRDKLRWEDVDKGWADVLEQHLVDSLSDEDATWFLKRAGIPDVHVERILQLSEGVPFYLDLSVDHYYQTAGGEEDSFPKTHRELYYNFMRYIDDQAVKITLKLLGLIRKWDRDIFRGVVIQFNTSVPLPQFIDFTRFSFVTELDSGRYTLHPLMRRHIREDLDRTDAKIVQDMWFFLRDHYSQRFVTDKIGARKMEDLEERTHYAMKCDTEEAVTWLWSRALEMEHQGFTQRVYDVWNTVLPRVKGEKKLVVLNALGWLKLKIGEGIESYIQMAEEALEEVSELTEFKAWLHVALGRLEMELQNYERSEMFLLKAEDIARQIGDLESLSSCLNNIAGLKFRQEEYQVAANYYEESLEIDRGTDDKIGISNNLKGLGECYAEWEQYDRALRYLEDSIIVDEDIGDLRGVARAKHKIGKILGKKKDFERGERTLLDSLQIFEQIDDSVSMSHVHATLGWFYFDRGDLAMAKVHVRKSQELRHSLDLPELTETELLGEILKQR